MPLESLKEESAETSKKKGIDAEIILINNYFQKYILDQEFILNLITNYYLINNMRIINLQNFKETNKFMFKKYGGVLNAFNIKTNEYKYDFLLENIYNNLCQNKIATMTTIPFNNKLPLIKIKQLEEEIVQLKKRIDKLEHDNSELLNLIKSLIVEDEKDG
ncbi:hypothetical protein [Thomasclavelia cocleata]|jgi:hypothetical protein|uniref:hypothetical protein n=1 Tax=Thomasclavelia cocleata TaxID=69824 RepID=UPI00242CEF28|nr:hypothetical protein [Thomasclavelia cocleata]MCI9629530.1 hypothetical protein [Thomasclavelia cocleata]